MRSDADLVAGIVAGNPAAEEEFDDRFRLRVLAVARHNHVPAADCEDVAQNVLSDAIRQLRAGRFRADATLHTWLYPLIRGHIANYWRKHDPVQAVSKSAVVNRDIQVVQVTDVGVTVWVQQALATLSARDRFLLWLHEELGHTLEEMCPILRLKKSAVHAQIQRARENLRAALRDGGKTPASRRLKG